MAAPALLFQFSKTTPAGLETSLRSVGASGTTHTTPTSARTSLCERDLEGIVAKYARGVCQTNHEITSWLKMKNPNYSHAEGRAELFEQRRSPERRSRNKISTPKIVLA